MDKRALDARRDCRVCGTALTSENSWPSQWAHRIFICKSCERTQRTARRRAKPDAARVRSEIWREQNREKIRASNADYRARKSQQIAERRAGRDRERERELNRVGRARIKLETMMRYGRDGRAECVRCGFDDLRALSIDHMSGNGRKHRQQIGGGGDRLYRWLRANGWPRGFQTLCFNCQIIKKVEHREYGPPRKLVRDYEHADEAAES